MDLGTARKAVRAILSSKPPEISKIVVSLTSNGEPLINLNMVDALISYCDDLSRKEGCQFTFNFATNATILDKSAIDRILSHDNLTIFFSLDGSEREHDRLRPYRNGRASYRDVLSNIRLYEAAIGKYPGRHLASSTVITTYNLDIASIYRTMLELGFQNILTRPVRGPAEWKFALNQDTLADFKSAYTHFYQFLDQTIDRGNTVFIESMTPAYDYFARPLYVMMLNERRLYGCPHCPPADAGADVRCYSTTYDSNGDVIFPCRDVIGIERFKIGSLDQGISEERLRDTATRNSEGKTECAGCWARYICGGGCYLLSYYAHKDIARPDGVMCELTRHVTKLAMKFLVHLEEEHRDLYEVLKNRAMRKVPWHVIYGC